MELAHGDVIRLVALGDSMTDEYAPRSWGGSPFFDRNWVESIRNYRGSEVTINNIALAGATSSSLLLSGQATAARDLFASGQADYATLIIGANDLAWDYHFALFAQLAEPAPYADIVFGNIRSAVETILHAPNAKLILATIPDVTVTDAFALDRLPSVIAKRTNFQAAIQMTNAKIIELAADYELPYIDLWRASQVLTDGPFVLANVPVARRLAVDGFHPSSTLQGILANTVLEALSLYGEETNGWKLTDQEILAAQGLASPNSVPQYLDVSPFVSRVPEPGAALLAFTATLGVATVILRRFGLRPARLAVSAGLALVFSTPPAQAELWSFSLDSNQSVLNFQADISIPVYEVRVPIHAQGDVGRGIPGFSNGFSTQVSGSLAVNIDASLGLASLSANLSPLNSGYWEPGSFGATGSSPAQVGAYVDLNPILSATAVASIRNFAAAINSPTPRSLSSPAPGTFNVDSAFPIQFNGRFDFRGLTGLGSLLGSSYDYFGDVATNNADPVLIEVNGDGSRSITMPVSVQVSVPLSTGLEDVFGDISVELSIHGTLVGNGSAPPPPPVGIFDIEPNNRLDQASRLPMDQFNLDPNDQIGDMTGVNTSTAIPHLTIQGFGDGSFDYFRFTVPSGESRGIFDVDGASFDSMIFLFDSIGALLAVNDDSSTTLGGSGSNSSLDSFLQYTFGSSGDYYLGIGRYFTSANNGVLTGNPLLNGDTYQLHVSIEGVPEVPSLTLSMLGLGGVILVNTSRMFHRRQKKYED